MKVSNLRDVLVVALSVCCLAAGPAFAGTYYIAPDGSNSTGDGSAAKPWASIYYAASVIPDDGSTIYLKDGIYTTQSFGRSFTKPMTVQALNPYKAIVQTRSDTSRAFTIGSGSNVTISGLNIYGTGSTASEYLIHITGASTQNITFQNNIIHDNFTNDLVKINDRAHDITFRGNVLYNQDQASNMGNELFDINTVQNINVEGNIMLANYARSGQTNLNQLQSFVVIKNSGTSSPDYTRNVNVSRNIFMSWAGKSDQSFLLFGEDGMPFWEAQDCMVENNLFLMNNNTNPTPGAIMLKGGIKGITIRANTISGNPAGGGGYGAVIQRIGSNAQMQDITFVNNIWTDQSGGMVRFSSSTTNPIVQGGLTLYSNVYWNGGKAIPTGTGVLNPSLDAAKILANPGLPDPAGMVDSWWDPVNLQFLSGTTSIADEFARVVALYGALPAGSVAIDKADPTNMPAVDIMGNLRDSAPDIGCYEYVPEPTTLTLLALAGLAGLRRRRV